MEKLKVLDLFSGIGGFSLGLERAGMETVAFCEIDTYCQKVLNRHWPDVPVFSDIRKLSRSDFEKSVDIICGGFPCQPFSLAGRKKGKEDDRDLWPEMFRVIQEYRPTWVIGENVANFTNMAFQRTKINLESEGYQVQPFIIPACGIEARHRRDRVWIIAYSDGNQLRKKQECKFGGERPSESSNNGKAGQFISEYATGSRLQEKRVELQTTRLKQYGELDSDATNALGERTTISTKRKLPSDQVLRGESEASRVVRQWRSFEPPVCGVAPGVSDRVDRIKALGNSVVPQIPEIIGRAILSIEGAKNEVV